MDEIPDDAKCPICLDIPSDQIYQCRNSHVLCLNCSKNILMCPQCRVPFHEGKVRNRALESVLDKLSFSCPHKASGCTEKLKRTQIQNHVENCRYNGKCVHFCNEIGFNCDFWLNTYHISKAIEHFQYQHGFIVRRGWRVAFRLEKFKDETSSITKDSMWTPIILSSSGSYGNARGSTFLILSFYNSGDKSVFWVAIIVDDESADGFGYEANFQIQNISKTKELQWKTPAVPVFDIKETMQTSPFRIPIALLKKSYLDSDGNLVVNFSVTQKEPNPDENCDLEATSTFRMPLVQRGIFESGLGAGNRSGMYRNIFK